MTGVGGFGYFDCEPRRFVICSAPAIRECLVTALVVDGGNVWFGASSPGEYIAVPCRLLRWGIDEKQVHAYKFAAVVNAMTQYHDDL